MYKLKNLSTRGINALHKNSTPVHGKATPSAGMGNAGEASAHAHGSVMKANADDGAFNEPLVVDIASMHDDHTKPQSPPLTPPPSQHLIGEEQDSSLSDEEYDTGTFPAPAPPDFTRRGIHIPSRTSSNTPAANKKRISMQRRLSSDTASLSMSRTPESQQARARGPSRAGSSTPTPNITSRPSTQMRNQEPIPMRSSADSVISFESSAPSFATQALPPLQPKALDDEDRLSPLLEDDPQSFDLVAPVENQSKQTSLEDLSENLFSRDHLQAIFNDTPSLIRFTSFLSATRPKSVPILIYYLDALKALRAINYANAVAEALEPIEKLPFTDNPARPTVNAVLEEKANAAFDVLVRDDLPAFITHVFTHVASASISKRVTGNLPPMLREASEGLAEVFCLTDPSRTDNPIIFASEEFHRTTQYGVGYAIGRNCRFLQGPKTNRSSVARFKEMITSGKEHSEVFLNYRRDGSPFMNLLMTAPLLDSRGNLRYFIGAQIDVTGLVKDGTDLDAWQRLRQRQQSGETREEIKDEFQELSRMFNHSELDIVRKHGGNMHREVSDYDDASTSHMRPRVLIQDQGAFDTPQEEQKLNPNIDGRLSGPYKHYLLLRPAPSLRILFSSPSLRVPGILQSPFLERIGGNDRVRASVGNALSDATRGVTAKIRWLSRACPNLEEVREEGRPRWIHCTPLLGSSGTVGVWMVVLIDEERHSAPSRRFRQAPPVANNVRNGRDSGRNRIDAWDDLEYDAGYPSRTTSRMEGQFYNANGTPRHAVPDSFRTQSSPRSPGHMYEQRALRSASSSIRDYALGQYDRRHGSTETFDI